MSPGVSLPALVLLGQDLPCLRAALMQEFPCQQSWNQAGWSHHGWCYRTPWQGFSPWEQRAKGKGSIPPKYPSSDFQGVTTAVLLNLMCSALHQTPNLPLLGPHFFLLTDFCKETDPWLCSEFSLSWGFFLTRL